MVIISSMCMGSAGITLALWHTTPSAMIGAAILGIGFGCYLSVDQALITQVLPHVGGFTTLYLAMVATDVTAALLVTPMKAVR